MQIEFRQQQKLVGIAAGCISHLVLVFYPLVFPATHTIKKREKNKVHFSISADATRPRTHTYTHARTLTHKQTQPTPKIPSATDSVGAGTCTELIFYLTTHEGFVFALSFYWRKRKKRCKV